MKILSVLFFLIGTYQAHAGNEDPNDYFKDRDWKIEITKGAHIIATSKYLSEPVRSPNYLKAALICGSKKPLEFIKELKYCGIDSIKTIGGKLEIMFVDFNSEHTLGYCTKKRVQYFKIPACPPK